MYKLCVKDKRCKNGRNFKEFDTKEKAYYYFINNKSKVICGYVNHVVTPISEMFKYR